MLVRFGKICAVFVLVTMLGANWAMWQTVAWTTMLASNLRTHSITEAMSNTFDGRHPCCLCRAIAAAKKSEKKDAVVSSAQRFEFPPTGDSLILSAPPVFRMVPSLDSHAVSRLQKPPVPPPRSCFV